MLAIVSILLLAVLVIMQWPSQYRIKDTLYRIDTGGVRTKLVDGAAIHSGDRLVLVVTTTVPMYVFVFAEDVHGNAWRLFPDAPADLVYPLRADATHTLPAEGGGVPAWVIGDETELASVHILACAEPVPEFATLYRDIPALQQGDRATVPASPLIAAAHVLDEEADIAIGVTYRVVKLQSRAD